jgi:hypothetical protein
MLVNVATIVDAPLAPKAQAEPVRISEKFLSDARLWIWFFKDGRLIV